MILCEMDRTVRRALSIVSLAGLLALNGCPADEPVATPKAEQEAEDVELPYPNLFPTAPKVRDYNYVPAWTTSHGLAVSDERLFVANAGGAELVVMDRALLSVVDRIALGGAPEQLVVDADEHVWLTLRDTGELVRVDPVGGEPLQRVKLGMRAAGLALDGDAKRVFALAPIEQQLVMLDADTLEELERRPTMAVPTAVAVGGAELDTVYVAHRHEDVMTWHLDADGVMQDGQGWSLPLQLGTPTDRTIFPTRIGRLVANGATAIAVDPGSGLISVAHTQATPGALSDLAALVQGVVVDPSGPPAVAPYYGAEQIPDTYHVPTRPVEVMLSSFRGVNPIAGINRAPVMEPVSGEPLSHLISDPRDVAFHPTRSVLAVVGEGSDSVVFFNSHHEDMMVSPVAFARVVAMPRAIAFSKDGQFAYVLGGHDYQVSAISLAPLWDAPLVMPKRAEGFDRGGALRWFADPLANFEQIAVVQLKEAHKVPFGVDQSSAAVRRGRRWFHAARNSKISLDGHFSCATCHPGGGDDKLVWVVTHGPRQTPSLAGRLKNTAPYNWNGAHSQLINNMERTIKRMGGTGLSSDERKDVAAFLLDALEEPPNPHRLPDGLSYQQKWGKQLFENPVVGCSGCHSGPDTTNNGNFDVGTALPQEIEAYRALAERDEVDVFDPRIFNVPSLRGLYASAPYLHTGAAPTLMAVLEQTDGAMGKTGHLTLEEKEALIAYLLTL